MPMFVRRLCALHSLLILLSQVGLLFDPDLLVDVSHKSQSEIVAEETRRNLYVLGLPHDFSLSVALLKTHRLSDKPAETNSKHSFNPMVPLNTL